jgi:hypothetical protein
MNEINVCQDCFDYWGFSTNLHMKTVHGPACDICGKSRDFPKNIFGGIDITIFIPVIMKRLRESDQLEKD